MITLTFFGVAVWINCGNVLEQCLGHSKYKVLPFTCPL